MTYKEVARLMKRADYGTVQSTNNRVNQAYQDILRSGSSPYPRQQTLTGSAGPTAPASSGWFTNLATLLTGGGLAFSIIPKFMQSFKNKIPTGEQFGRSAYNGVKQAVGQDLAAAGTAIKNKVGETWGSAKQLFSDFSQQFAPSSPTSPADRASRASVAINREINPNYISSPITQNEVQAQRRRRGLGPSKKLQQLQQNPQQPQPVTN